MGIDDKNKFAGSAASDAPASEPFTFSNFTGSPYFAVDITPRGGTADKATALIEASKAKGFSFFANTRSMSLRAEEGRRLLSSFVIVNLVPSC